MKLQKVVLPESIQAVRDSAFEDCSSLSEINIPRSMVRIGIAAFNETAIEKVRIPRSVNIIHDIAFDAEVKIYGGIISPAQRYAEKNGNEFHIILG